MNILEGLTKDSPVPHPTLVWLDYPERGFHHRLHSELDEAFTQSSGYHQLMIVTCSSALLGTMQPQHVHVLTERSFGQIRGICLAELSSVCEAVANGAQIGWLWHEGYLPV